MIASGLNIIAGVWLIIAPFVLGYWNPGRAGTSAAELATSNDLIVGFVVTVIAAIQFFGDRWIGPDLFQSRTTQLSWANVILGLWLIASPFVLDFASLGAALWNNLIVGVVVSVLAGWYALRSRAALR